jgi:hypothetical protein
MGKRKILKIVALGMLGFYIFVMFLAWLFVR